MQIRKTFILGGLVFATICLINGDHNNLFRFTKGDCKVYNPDVIQNMTCSTKAINRTLALFNLECTVTEVLNDIFLHVQIFKRAEVKYLPFLINTMEDYCSFFAKKSNSRYMRLLSRLYLPFSNFNHTCPFTGPLVIKDFYMDPLLAPSIWPSGDYRILVEVINSKIKLFSLALFLEIREKGI